MKAVAFDLGRVIFDFDYNVALEKIKDKINIPPQEIINALFYHNFTDDFEKGLISPEDFYRRFCKKTGFSLSFEEFSPVWSDIFTLKPETPALIKALKPFYKILLISNLNQLHYEFLKQKYPEVFSLFDAEILSYKVGELKPSVKIYDLLISTAEVGKEELVYIDDREDLITESRKQGINSIQFNDIEQCINELKEFGVYIPSEDDLSIFKGVEDFLDNQNIALLSLGNEIREDDSLGPRLAEVLSGNLKFKVFDSGTVPENVPLREFGNVQRLLVVDSSRLVEDNFVLSGLEKVLSLNPFSTHTSLLFFEFLKKEVNLDILFLLVRAEKFGLGESLSLGAEARKKIIEQFFLRNFPKSGGADVL